MRLLMVGGQGGTHVGGSLWRAAVRLGWETDFCNIQEAFRAPLWVSKFNWILGGHRPARLGVFSRKVLRACETFKPQGLLATGLAPIEREALRRIGEAGVKRVNYLTDDPWNRTFRSSWIFQALPHYDQIFSVRRANLEQLKQEGCRAVEYLPFGYDPELCYPDPPVSAEEEARFRVDVVFAGAGDADRVPWIAALIRAGFKVGLYGSYWDRFRETRGTTQGQVDPLVLRKAISGAKVALCLVQWANRDGNSMRSFEIPAIGICMLTEYTQEHREIFGEDRKAVVYFRTIPEMIEKCRWLLGNPQERLRLSRAAHELIVRGKHTYRDRLLSMLGSE